MPPAAPGQRPTSAPAPEHVIEHVTEPDAGAVDETVPEHGPGPGHVPASRPGAGRAAEPTPGVVVLHVWGVPRRGVPGAVARMALDRPLLRRSGAGFWKLLGTGDGRTFTARDADPRHWALLTTWPDTASADAFEASRTVRAWSRLQEERLRVVMRPVVSRGTWSGRTPFGDPSPDRAALRGPVASITRARIRPTKDRAFRRAVPPVSTDLHQVPGLRLAVGIGEAPVGLQGTFSLWAGAGDLNGFAHARAPHRAVVERTEREQWYAEELFARFAVLDVSGTHEGKEP